MTRFEKFIRYIFGACNTALGEDDLGPAFRCFRHRWHRGVHYYSRTISLQQFKKFYREKDDATREG